MQILVYKIHCQTVRLEIYMGKGIYTYYKERLVEIGGNNKCLYLKNMVRRGAYDIGKLFEGRDKKTEELVQFLLTGKEDSLTLISEEETKDLIKNIGLPTRPEANKKGMSLDEIAKESVKQAKLTADDRRKILDGEVSKIKDLCREVEDIERETGRNELYIGYPFVFGTLNQGPKKMLIKAPLMLFPVKVDFPDERTVEIRLNKAERAQINRALIFAYAQSKRINIDDLPLDLDELNLKSVKQVVEYLAEGRVRIDYSASNHLYDYTRFKEPDERGELALRYAAVLGRFQISNSIYNDYTLLEKKNLTNDAINELLRTNAATKSARISLLQKARAKDAARRAKRAKRMPVRKSYIVKMLDYAQSEVVRRVDECGNVVIYGPPGTGKSQTIVNIITDAMAKDKRVLVVSQKKAALDVVFSRLGTLNEKAMYINDESRSKKDFYERCFETHKREIAKASQSIEPFQEKFDDIQSKIDADTAQLEAMYHTLSDKRAFGLSLLEMYSSSYMPAKNSTEYSIYLKLSEAKDVIALNYKQLSDALFSIKANDLSRMYYDFLIAKEKNPLIDTMKADLDLKTLNEVKSALDIVHKKRRAVFNLSDYPYLRQALAFYQHVDGNEKNVKAIVKLQAKLEKPTSPLRFTYHDAINQKFIESVELIDGYADTYDCLNRIMTRDGFMSVIDNLIRGNTSYIKLVYDLIDNYIAIRDVGKLLDSIDRNMSAILNFAYSASKNYQSYIEIIDKLLVLRIYHELVVMEEECKSQLAALLDFNNVSSRIYKNKAAQLEAAAKLCSYKSSAGYKELYDNSEKAKDYLYQIEKEQNFWSIRKTMEVYGEFILTLFPCWLLSPENVSSLLPLTKNMFDIVIFDEASQVFIESTIPTIYRGKSIVVAGDSKQLRPSATFMKRYMGSDPETIDDYSMQAALEVESLLDLAMARYDSANLTYHYRSRHQELIDFSNNAFYNGNLQIAPNISTNKKNRPIERYKVDGKWLGRTNPVEARKVVDIVKNILETRKKNESIGIITFNSDQQSCIADAFEAAGKADPKFRAALTKEKQRLEGGEDTGLFIKNLENVQGDERDIIIFSIGYAPNELGKLYTNFGSLSTEGGENRLNVAITRAKCKIIVVTIIEPEDLRVDTAKNQGPKLLRDYLTYVRAVSDGDDEHTKAILNGLCPTEKAVEHIDTGLRGVEYQIKERLEAAGYTVHTGLGNKNNRISLAVYDEKLDRYLVGVELDRDAFESSDSALERDVYKPKFLEAHGWHILRVWCRDWWLYPARVIKTITNAAEKVRDELTKK